MTTSTYLSRIYTLSAHNNPVVFKHKKLFYHESGQTLEEKKTKTPVSLSLEIYKTQLDKVLGDPAVSMGVGTAVL